MADTGATGGGAGMIHLRYDQPLAQGDPSQLRTLTGQSASTIANHSPSRAQTCSGYPLPRRSRIGCSTPGPVRTARSSIQGPTTRPLTTAARHAGGGGATTAPSSATAGGGGGGTPPEKSAARRRVAERTAATDARTILFMSASTRAVVDRASDAPLGFIFRARQRFRPRATAWPLSPARRAFLLCG